MGHGGTGPELRGLDVLAEAARHGWTPRDINQLITDWIGTGHWIPESPHKPIGLLGAILAAHGNLEERPAALEVAREQAELAASAASGSPRSSPSGKTNRQAREAGRAALVGAGPRRGRARRWTRSPTGPAAPSTGEPDGESREAQRIPRGRSQSPAAAPPPCHRDPDRWFDRADRTDALATCLACPVRRWCARQALRTTGVVGHVGRRLDRRPPRRRRPLPRRDRRRDPSPAPAPGERGHATSPAGAGHPSPTPTHTTARSAPPPPRTPADRPSLHRGADDPVERTLRSHGAGLPLHLGQIASRLAGGTAETPPRRSSTSSCRVCAATLSQPDRQIAVRLGYLVDSARPARGRSVLLAPIALGAARPRGRIVRDAAAPTAREPPKVQSTAATSLPFYRGKWTAALLNRG